MRTHNGHAQTCLSVRSQGAAARNVNSKKLAERVFRFDEKKSLDHLNFANECNCPAVGYTLPSDGGRVTNVANVQSSRVTTQTAGTKSRLRSPFI